MTTSKLTIVTINYVNLAFDSTGDALRFYELASQAVLLDAHYGSLPGGTTPVEYVVSPVQSLSLAATPADKACLTHTLAQLQDLHTARQAASTPAEEEPSTVSTILDPDFQPMPLPMLDDDIPF